MRLNRPVNSDADFTRESIKALALSILINANILAWGWLWVAGIIFPYEG